MNSLSCVPEIFKELVIVYKIDPNVTAVCPGDFL